MKINKIFCVAALAATTALSAESKFNGLHLGVQGGLQYTSVGIDAKDGLDKTANRTNASPSGAAFGFAVGYLHEIMNDFYTGVELEYNLSGSDKNTNLEATSLVQFYDIKVKAKSNYGGSLVFGYAFGRAMPFVKLGYSKTNMQYTVNRDEDAGTSAASTTKRSKALSGFKFGLGTQVAISDCFLTSFEYGHQFGSKKVRVNPPRANAGAAALGSHRDFVFKPSTHTVMLRLTYRFGM